MRPIGFVLVAVASVAGVAGYTGQSAQQTSAGTAVYVTKMPVGYRDYRLISVSHEAGGLNSIGAALGNDVAIKAYRAKTLPYAVRAVATS